VGLEGLDRLPEAVERPDDFIDHAPRTNRRRTERRHSFDHAANFVGAFDPADGGVDTRGERRGPILGHSSKQVVIVIMHAAILVSQAGPLPLPIGRQPDFVAAARRIRERHGTQQQTACDVRIRQRCPIIVCGRLQTSPGVDRHQRRLHAIWRVRELRRSIRVVGAFATPSGGTAGGRRRTAGG